MTPVAFNLPNGVVARSAQNGDVTISIPSSGPGAIPGLSAVTITPAGIVTGRDMNGMPVAVGNGTVFVNPVLRGLLEQIAPELPEEYRRKWGLRGPVAGVGAGEKVSLL